jgi:5-hydroxyisourate hydrolase
MPARSSVTAQLASIKNHLTSSAPQPDIKPSKNSTMSERPPITCHVLDTTIGAPAAGISVTLKHLSSTTAQNDFTGITNDDGRVTEWKSATGGAVSDIFKSAETDLIWTLEFSTESYWEQKGIKPFFPKVTLQFATQSFKTSEKGEQAHWHVPLLLGPYNYTTYRGS